MPKFHPRITTFLLTTVNHLLKKHKKDIKSQKLNQILNHVMFIDFSSPVQRRKKWKNLNGQTRGLGSSWIGRKPPIDIQSYPPEVRSDRKDPQVCHMRSYEVVYSPRLLFFRNVNSSRKNHWKTTCYSIT